MEVGKGTPNAGCVLQIKAMKLKLITCSYLISAIRIVASGGAVFQGSSMTVLVSEYPIPKPEPKNTNVSETTGLGACHKGIKF